MSMRYDAIIIGAGHNGLITQAYLAKAGLKVISLDAAWVVRRLFKTLLDAIDLVSQPEGLVQLLAGAYRDRLEQGIVCID